MERNRIKPTRETYMTKDEILKKANEYIAGNAAGGMTVPLLTRGNQNETQVSSPKQ